MSSDPSFATLFAQIADAFTAYVTAMTDAERIRAAENPHVRPVQPVAAAPAPAAQPAPVAPAQTSAPAPAPTPAPAAPVMTQVAFISEATAILQRHGGDQAPLVPLMAAWNVTQPANQLPPEQFPAFLSQMRQAYGEAA